MDSRKNTKIANYPWFAWKKEENPFDEKIY